MISLLTRIHRYLLSVYFFLFDATCSAFIFSSYFMSGFKKVLAHKCSTQLSSRIVVQLYCQFITILFLKPPSSHRRTLKHNNSHKYLHLFRLSVNWEMRDLCIVSHSHSSIFFMVYLVQHVQHNTNEILSYLLVR